MMRARVTVDQIAQSGGCQRYGPVEVESLQLDTVVEQALEDLMLGVVEVGHYQITVTDLDMKDHHGG